MSRLGVDASLIIHINYTTKLNSCHSQISCSLCSCATSKKTRTKRNILKFESIVVVSLCSQREMPNNKHISPIYIASRIGFSHDKHSLSSLSLLEEERSEWGKKKAKNTRFCRLEFFWASNYQWSFETLTLPLTVTRESYHRIYVLSLSLSFSGEICYIV
jgi:hypothetical protein